MSTVTSLYNDNYINQWDWSVSETLHTTEGNQTPNVSEYSHIFTDAGYSDINLTVTSQHGCSDTQDSTEVVLLNTYTMTITGSDTICFNGLSEVIQDFSVDILADIPDLPYNLEGSWSIISSNAAFAIEDFQNDSTSRYTFTQPGRYTLQYSALIDGTDSDCEYETTHEFNVGVDSKIKDDYSSKICVGGDNFIAQYDDSFDTWSNL